MELEFADGKLRKRCERHKEAVRAWGRENADKLFQRLAELAAAATLEDMTRVAGARCHPLKGGRAGQFAVDLRHPKRLVFEPAGDPAAYGDARALRRERITAIRILEVVDYHE